MWKRGWVDSYWHLFYICLHNTLIHITAKRLKWWEVGVVMKWLVFSPSKARPLTVESRSVNCEMRSTFKDGLHSCPRTLHHTVFSSALGMLVMRLKQSTLFYSERSCLFTCLFLVCKEKVRKLFPRYSHSLSLTHSHAYCWQYTHVLSCSSVKLLPTRVWMHAPRYTFRQEDRKCEAWAMPF